MKFLTKTPISHAVALAMLVASGCASLTSGARQQFKIDSEPSGATISFNGRVIGMTPFEGTVPRAENARILLEKEGYETAVVERHAKMNPAVAGNLVSWFIPGVIVDISTGAFYKFRNPVVNEALRKKQSPQPVSNTGTALPPAQPQPEKIEEKPQPPAPTPPPQSQPQPWPSPVQEDEEEGTEMWKRLRARGLIDDREVRQMESAREPGQ